MSVGVSLMELMEFTAWERNLWFDWLSERGDSILAISVGPHGDGRFQSVGDLVKHIFIAEKQHIDRLSNRPLTGTASVPSGSLEGLFQFGRRSRKDLEEFVAVHPAEDWDVPREFDILNNPVSVTPRKFVAHILTHEIRHWAQIATMLRLNGFLAGLPDFLLSPVMGGGLKSHTA
jgi:uncharacterized damage-inducible protein DinB